MMPFMNFSNYLQMLNGETASQVQGFFSPPEPLVRDSSGIPQYGGASFNAYQGINPYQYSGMDRDDNPADKLYADLIRAQTRDYNTRFAPLENFLASEITATGTKSLAGDMTRTQDAVIGAGENIQ